MRPQFIVKIENIPPEGLRIQNEWDIQTVEKILHKDSAIYKPRTPLSLNLSFLLFGEKVIFEGNLQLEIKVDCVSCLSEYIQPLQADFRYVLWPQSTASAERELELHQEDMEIGYYHGDSLDVVSLIREQIYLSLPLNPHCHEGCRGLCPVCGINLNEKQCTCSVKQQTKDSPFAILKKLRK